MKKIVITISLIISLIILSMNYVFASSNNYILKFDLNKNSFERTVNIEEIYPGCSGIIEIDLDNSQNTKYKISFNNEKDKPENLYFSYNGKNYKNLNDIENEINLSQSKKIIINYFWNYETGKNVNEIKENDLIDTKSQSKEFTFDILLNVEKNEITKLPKTGF